MPGTGEEPHPGPGWRALALGASKPTNAPKKASKASWALAQAQELPVSSWFSSTSLKSSIKNKIKNQLLAPQVALNVLRSSAPMLRMTGGQTALPICRYHRPDRTFPPFPSRGIKRIRKTHYPCAFSWRGTVAWHVPSRRALRKCICLLCFLHL